MRVSAGVDIVSIARVEGMLKRWGERFLRRIYTDGEVAYSMGRAFPARSLAARFAAKEAFYKAVSAESAVLLGRGSSGIGHRTIEVIVSRTGAPLIKPHGKAKLALGGRDVCLSLSHEQDLAVALVVTSGGRSFPGSARRRATGRRRRA